MINEICQIMMGSHINNEVYIAPKVGTMVVGLLHSLLYSFSTHGHYSIGMRMPSLLVSDNVFKVGASVRTFVELQNVLHLFEQQTHSQFYMRDA